MTHTAQNLGSNPILWPSCLFALVDEVQAIASLIEKQAQIVVKQKEVSEEAKRRKEALLAQYANVTDEEEYPYSVSGKRKSDKRHCRCLSMCGTVCSTTCLSCCFALRFLTSTLKGKTRTKRQELWESPATSVSFTRSCNLTSGGGGGGVPLLSTAHRIQTECYAS